MTIANRLKEERMRLGYSQTRFAVLGGVGHSSHILYETGERRPDTKYLEGIYQHGADVNYILTGQRTNAEPSMIRLAQRLSHQYDQILAIAKQQERTLSPSEFKTILGFAFMNGAAVEEIEAFMAFHLDKNNSSLSAKKFDSLFRSLKLEDAFFTTVLDETP